MVANTTPTVVDRLTDDWFVDYGEGKDMCRCALLMISVRNADMGVDAFSFERMIARGDSRYAPPCTPKQSAPRRWMNRSLPAPKVNMSN